MWLSVGRTSTARSTQLSLQRSRQSESESRGVCGAMWVTSVSSFWTVERSVRLWAWRSLMPKSRTLAASSLRNSSNSPTVILNLATESRSAATSERNKRFSSTNESLLSSSRLFSPTTPRKVASERVNRSARVIIKKCCRIIGLGIIFCGSVCGKYTAPHPKKVSIFFRIGTGKTGKTGRTGIPVSLVIHVTLVTLVPPITLAPRPLSLPSPCSRVSFLIPAPASRTLIFNSQFSILNFNCTFAPCNYSTHQR